MNLKLWQKTSLKVSGLYKPWSTFLRPHCFVSGEDCAKMKVQGLKSFEEQVGQETGDNYERRKNPEETRRQQIAVNHEEVHVVAAVKDN